MNLFLSNVHLSELRLRTDKVSAEIQINYYELFKSVQDLVINQNYVGPYADCFRNYLQTVTMQILAEFLELSEEIAQISRKIENDLHRLESFETGIIARTRLVDTRSRLLTRQNEFQDYIAKVSRTNERIKNLGVSTGALGGSDVVNSYNDSRRTLLDIDTELNIIDRQNLAELSRIEARIDRLCSMLSKVGKVVMQGSVDFASLKGLSISTGTPHVLLVMMAQDPRSSFGNLSGKGAAQWSQWLDDGSFENGSWMFWAGNISQHGGANWQLQGDLFNWKRTKHTGRFEVNWTQQQLTAGQVFLASRDGHAAVSFTGVRFTETDFGRDHLLGGTSFASAQGNFLSGSAFFNWQPKSKNDFNFGLGANASIAGVGVSAGCGSGSGSVSGEIGAVAGGGLNISSQEIRNTGSAQINYITIDFSKPGLGTNIATSISGEVSIPNVIWNW